jgi:Family of unknown function (DUF6491)
MNTPRTALLATLLGMGLTSAFASEAAKKETALLPPQASIPFVDLRSIRDWHPDERKGLWIQDIRRQWYYAKLMAPCMGLDFALEVGFDTRTSNTLDRFAYIVVPREDRCPIMSLTKSDPPPPGRKRGKALKPVVPPPDVQAVK